ncbi:MAG: hypothetical protein Q8K64_12755 [Sediminibacterium sp.]|nr:hypothetical protein [Sediminibacterium sp.]
MNENKFDVIYLESKIKSSNWWKTALKTIDSHYTNERGVMLSHHLEAVYQNIENIFNYPEIGFYKELFGLLHQINLDKESVKNHLKIVALLHDLGKIEEDKTLIIPHPLTGKPAHKRHGLVGLMAAMEIIGNELEQLTQEKLIVYRTVELHDISFGLFREYRSSGDIPKSDKLSYIAKKIHPEPGAGILYLLIFKLADIHGHQSIEDVIWFYKIAASNYYKEFNIQLPIPTESDIR